MTHLYLIRHAESLNAVERRLGDLELSPRGIKQAERLRDRLAATREIRADVLISSTFRRAYQTAELLAPALGLPIVPDDEFQELREGEAAGLTEEEFLEKYGAPEPATDPFRRIAPGGESWPEFLLRVGRALHRIIHEHAGKTIVVVCHGGVIEGSFFYFFGLSTLTRPAVGLLTENTAITHWQLRPSFPDRQLRWHLLSYNDYFHLRDLDLARPFPWRELFGGHAPGSDASS
jgi:probable phosphoglycerate mutase